MDGGQRSRAVDNRGDWWGREGRRRRRALMALGGRRSEEAQRADQLSAVMSLPACTITSSALRRGAQQREAEGPASAIQWTLLYNNCIDLLSLLEDFPRNNPSFSKTNGATCSKRPSSSPECSLISLFTKPTYCRRSVLRWERWKNKVFVRAAHFLMFSDSFFAKSRSFVGTGSHETSTQTISGLNSGDGLFSYYSPRTPSF